MPIAGKTDMDITKLAIISNMHHHLKMTKTEIRMSVLKYFKRCLKFSETLRKVVLNKLSIKMWLTDDFLPLMNNAFCEAPFKIL